MIGTTFGRYVIASKHGAASKDRRPPARAGGSCQGGEAIAPRLSGFEAEPPLSGYAGLIGQSEKMKKVYRLISKVALQRHPVLIMGESGTGKELVARAIHTQGPWRDHPFVPVA